MVKRKAPGNRTSRARKPAPAAAARTERTGRAPAAAPDALTIVAVGASAGGLEAFSQVIESLPDDPGVAFIFVQHLSPHHASALVELLSAKTTLAVTQAVNDTAIEANHIYVIPPNVQMDLKNGRLHLTPRPSDHTQFTPIDFFFQSVARWAKERTIGVVLSGTASDGAAGIREIKACGGITIAQKPESAKYDGMPRAAIATGMVDLVLTPKELAEQIAQIRNHPFLVAPTPARELTDDGLVTDAQLKEICVLLRRSSGIDFKRYKTPTIKRRLLRRMGLLRLTEVDAYLDFLSQHPNEVTALSRDLLIHVTRFFRDPETFAGLEEIVFPELLQRSSDEDVRIWVPGCASGEEAYSVAICLLEFLGQRALERRVQIFATDVSDASIDQARAGVYPFSISADVSPDRIKRFFSRSDAGYRVIKPLRDMCVFARHDLTRDPPFSRLNLIVCRNVLIYLDAVLQKRLMSVFHYALKTGGVLMLGPAETPGSQPLFSPLDKKWRLYRKMPIDAGLPRPTLDEIGDAPIRPLAPNTGRRQIRSVQDEANRLVLDRYSLPGVVVDGNWQIVQFRGRTGPFLEASAGQPNFSVLKMARGGLLHPLQAALHTARRRAMAVRRDGLHIQHEGRWREVSLEVVPLSTTQGEHYLVLFEEHALVKPGRTAPRKKGGRDVAGDRQVETVNVGLRRELSASRDYLQSIIQELEAANEELQSANEEILSSNEELQSANEELDTAKEELQSMNEELNTLNDELHARNEELTILNSDLIHLLASVQIPIVMVTRDLRIRRFTPAAERALNIIPSDVGRPIGHLKPNFLCPDL